MIERTFGRLEQWDERSKNFRIKKIVKQEVPITTLWDCKTILDQGNKPACVGFAGAHQAIATPVPQLNIDNNTGLLFYKGAQQNDDWPGENYDGSSAVGLLKYFLKIGFCKSGYWAFNLLEHRLGISFDSPALVGCSWMTGMMNVDSNGFVHATGVGEGGHETLWIGNNEEDKYFTIVNSWGEDWGQSGRAKISYDDAEKIRSSMDVLFIREEQMDWNKTPSDGGCFIAKAWVSLGNWLASITGSNTRIDIRR
jgi:hypothetical protein